MKIDKFLALLPKSIKIGPHDWKISLTNKMLSEKEGQPPPYGETEYRILEIRLNPDCLPSPAMAISVLLHELYHAGLFSLGASQPKKEEQAALFNETLYSMVFKDNVWLLDWMKKGYK